MEYLLELAADGRAAVVTTTGEISAGDVERYLDDVISRPEWQPGTGIVADISAADVTALLKADLMRVARAYSDRAAQLGSGRLALIADTEIASRISRLWAVYAGRDGFSLETRVFVSALDAFEWVAAG
jgi:hypothetical protein